MPTLVVLIFGYLLSQFYRSFLAVIAPELASDVHLGPTELGLVSAAFFAAFALVQLPIGASLDRFGARRTVAIPMLSAVAGATLFALAKEPWQSVVGMALIGFGCAPIYMGALWVIGRISSPARFAFYSSAIVGIGSLGNLAAATPLAAAAAVWGWRATMIAIAAATLAAAAAVFVVVKDPPAPVHVAEPGAPRPSLAAVLAIRELWPLYPIALLSYPILVAMRGLWVGPYFAEVHGLAPVDRGNAVSVMVFAMIAGAFVYAPLDRLFGTRKWVVTVGTVVTIAALFALALAPTMPVVAGAVAFGVIGGFGMTYGVLMAHARAFLPTPILGRGLTLMNMFLIGGAAVIQPLSGAYVAHLAALGATRPMIHASLYGAYGAALALSLVVYLFARDARPAA